MPERIALSIEYIDFRVHPCIKQADSYTTSLSIMIEQSDEVIVTDNEDLPECNSRQSC